MDRFFDGFPPQVQGNSALAPRILLLPFLHIKHGLSNFHPRLLVGFWVEVLASALGGEETPPAPCCIAFFALPEVGFYVFSLGGFAGHVRRQKIIYLGG